MKFTHLHVHSHYSLLDGLAKIDQLLDACQELKMSSIALTDHGSMYGLVEFFQKAKKRGIRPILGCEVYLAPNGMYQKRPNIDAKSCHLVLLIKNKKGYRNLVKLTTKANLEGFYYRPRIDKDLLREYSEGLIGMSACLAGEIPQAIISNNFKKAEELALEYKEIFGQDDFYLEIQHHPGFPEQKPVNEALIKISRKHNIPLVATNDTHYVKKEDAEAQDVLMSVQTDKRISDQNRLTMTIDDFSLRPIEEMIKDFKDTPDAIENTQKIIEKCNFEFELGKYQLPCFEVPKGQTPDKFLENLCKKGLKKRYPNINKKIIKRLNYELSVIKETGFASYFLIVQDFINWAKSKDIVCGPGRGSAAGSIIAYLLGITEIDPLKYDLLFERFLNPERISLPDIDLDFADARRDEVIEYVSKKYGEDHVAQIITFGTMAARAAVRDVGRVLDYPYNFCDQIAKMIPFGSTLEKAVHESPELHQSYESDKNTKSLIDMAMKLEGVIRHASTHACGVVITKEPLYDLVPCQRSTQGNRSIVTQYEMHAVEDLGLLKMDFLGLKTLTVIQNTLNQIKEFTKKEINLSKLLLDDKKTFELFQQANTTGVFQLECLSGETIVSNTTIKKLYERKNKKSLRSIYLDKGTVHKNKILNILSSGKKEIYTLITDNNWYIKASPDHNFLTENGWKQLKDIKKDEKILIKKKAKHLIYNTCKICNKQINGQKEGRSNYCYKCSSAFYKNPSKFKSRKKISEGIKQFYMNGGKPWNYNQTKENNKILFKTGRKISESLTGRSYEDLYGPIKAKQLKKYFSEKFSGSGNPMFGKKAPHRKGGYREDLKHYVRSNWEADFARILKLYDIKYEYEPKTFKLKSKNEEAFHYTPDFYVKSNNTFYEIKGWLHELDEKKMELFQEQYPQYNFVLISATKFAELALRYKNLIKWECPRIPTEKSFEFIKVKDIKYSGEEMTYDIVMGSPGNNFIANGFVVHNSGGMKRNLKELKPNKFEDIIAMVALYRPGPIEFIPEFIARKHGLKEVKYLHPKLKPILENTYGVMVYQEQLMRIARDLAGFSLSEADVLRKAVGKKIKKLLDEQKEKMIEGMINNEIDSQIAKRIWQTIEPFAQYGFNKSHSTCYALIGYQTAYLKAHYPTEFMAALITSEQNDIERIAFLIDDCKKMNIQVLPPDINKSFQNFTKAGEKTISFGLRAIKNVGQNVVQSIIEERIKNGEFKSISDFIERVESKDLNKKSLESLIKCGAFDNFGERNQLLGALEQMLSIARETQKAKQNGQRSLFGSQSSVATPSFRLPEVVSADKRERLSWEKELLGLYISEHPLCNYKNYLMKKASLCNTLSKNQAGHKIKIGGIINRIKKINTKTGQPMLFVEIEDITGRIEAIVFPNVLEKTVDAWQEEKIVLINGRLSDRDGNLKILCDSVKVLE